MTTIILPLDRAGLSLRLEAFLALDADTPGEPWGPEHFLRDLPGKWDCSRMALATGGQLAGFAIASVKPGALHLHRLVVASAHQGCGLGTRLLLAMAHAAQRRDLALISLKLARDNHRARRLYERLGFRAVPIGPVNLAAAVAVDQLQRRARGPAIALAQGESR